MKKPAKSSKKTQSKVKDLSAKKNVKGGGATLSNSGAKPVTRLKPV